ncbi:MAG: undecaprenyl-diphosphate phosphatase [Syntrophothermus sp.]
MEPITYLQAIILGAFQGVSELFPISSLGHAVILPSLFGWDIHQNDEFFLAFLVATHCATALVLFFFFLDDWKRIAAGLARSIRDGGRVDPEDTDARLGWVIVVGTIPAGLLGLALEHRLRDLFASPTSAAIFLAVNGILLLIFERFRRRAPRPGDWEGDSDPRIARMSFRQALAIGTAQAAALIPGISRSGVTMGGGLLTGLSNEDAARYAFLLATPIIAAAGFLKLPDLLGTAGDGVRGQALVAAIFAALTAWLSVKFLLRYFETNRLTPFGIYCIVAGITCTLIFAL